MRDARERGGFTVVELLIVLGILTILASLLFPVLRTVRTEARLAGCLSNIQQIATAVSMYQADNKGLPRTALPTALGDYMDSDRIFTCPEDERGADSYSQFFVARSGRAEDHFVLGCPRHHDGDRAAVAFGGGKGEADRTCTVRWNGSPLEPGTTVTGGTLSFTDGSQVQLAEDTTVGVLMSFVTSGRTYSLIWMPEGTAGAIDCQVTPGSRFEVLTPAAIASVQGTRFVVQTALEGEINSTVVACQEGKVWVRGRGSEAERKLTPGQQVLVRKHKKDCPADVTKHKGRKGKKDN